MTTTTRISPPDRVQFVPRRGRPNTWTALTRAFPHNPWKRRHTFTAPAFATRAQLWDAWGDAVAAEDLQ